MHLEHKYIITQKKHKKLKQSLVDSYDLWPGNGENLFLTTPEPILAEQMAYLEILSDFENAGESCLVMWLTTHVPLSHRMQHQATDIL